MRFRLVILCAILLNVRGAANGERIKDIVDIQGIRGNPLTGIGLVIGLAGTGDSTLPSRQMLTSIFRKSGIVLSPDDFSGGNIAVVMVTAELGPFAREGSRVDVDFRLDFVVDGLVVVELKAVEAIQPIHQAQVITYLKLAGLQAALLINFNTKVLKNGIRRVVLRLAE